MNQRGSVVDSVYTVTGLFVFAIVAVCAAIFMSVTNDAIQGIPGTYTAKTIMQDGADQFPGLLNLWFMTLFIGLPLASAVLAYLNNVHPFFFWLSLGFSFFTIILGKALEIAWNDFIADATILNYAETMPVMNFVLTHYGTYSFLVFIIIAVGTFVKLGGGVQQDAYGGLR